MRPRTAGFCCRAAPTSRQMSMLEQQTIVCVVTDPIYPTAQAEGFKLGMFVSYGECSDAWVRAPDGGIAGLIWETDRPEYFRVAIEPNPADRWGTFAVQLELPMTTNTEAEAYLRALLPLLIPYWHAWADSS
jgi:hypothetical protein